MIKECLVVLAVVAQISAFRPNYEAQNCRPYNKPGNGRFEYSFSTPTQGKEKYERYPAPEQKPTAQSNAQSKPMRPFQSNMYKNPSYNTAPTTKNLIAKGKFPVALQSYGPVPDKKIPVYTSHIRVPVQEKPTVRLPSKIPTPKTIAHSCTCIKTIVKPRVHQTLITVPSIQRYIETLHKPVVENIHYEACPIECQESGSESQTQQTNVQNFQFSPMETQQNSANQVQQPSQMKIQDAQSYENSRVQTFDISQLLPERDATKSTKSETPVQMIESQKPHIIEIPRIEFVEAKRPQASQFGEEKNTQTIELPRIQFMESQKPQEVEFPRFQFVESQKPQIVEMPFQQLTESQKTQRPQFVEMTLQQLTGSQKNQNIEFPNIQIVEAKKSHSMETPQVQFLEAQKSQPMEMQRVQFMEAPKTQSMEMPRIQYVEAQKSQPMKLPHVQFVESEKFQAVEIPHTQGQNFKGESSQQNGYITFGSGANQSGQLFLQQMF